MQQARLSLVLLNQLINWLNIKVFWPIVSEAEEKWIEAKAN